MPTPLRAKDNAKGQLNAGISAAVLTIPLKSGEGVLFPQPYTGTATSSGTRTTLNSTGIGSSGVAVGDTIHNVTDDSWAEILSVSANSITTSRLKGGTDNLWDNGDTWRVNEFVVTLAAINAAGTDTAYEEVLISNRSTDNLTVPTGGRGYNGTVAQAFNADDHVQLRVTAPYNEELKKIIHDVSAETDTDATNISTNTTDITSLKTGSYHYVVATGSSNAYAAATPALAAYAAGNIVRFKANHNNTGAATINVNGLGAKTIKKKDGATDLSSGDILSGQIVEVQYDGTNFQMLSPTAANVPTLTLEHRHLKTSNTTTTSTSFTDIDGTNFTDDITCTANTILILTLTGSISHDASGVQMSFDFSVGGTRVGGSEGLMRIESSPTNSNFRKGLNLTHVVKPGAGTITVKPQWLTASGTATLFGNPTAVFSVLKIEP